MYKDRYFLFFFSCKNIFQQNQKFQIRQICMGLARDFQALSQNTHVRQPVYPEPLGGPLLAHAIVAEVELAVSQLLDLEESRQTVSQTAYLLLLLRPSLQSVRYVQREILEGLVRLRVCAAVHAVDLREETRSIIRPRFSQEENEEERDFG